MLQRTSSELGIILTSRLLLSRYGPHEWSTSSFAKHFMCLSKLQSCANAVQHAFCEKKRKTFPFAVTGGLWLAS